MVTNPVNLQPQATATETGTLTCPFPDPELNIVMAVRLSWPGYYNDYVLEWASEAKGSWERVDTPLLKEGGSLVAWARAEGGQKYFRLRKP